MRSALAVYPLIAPWLQALGGGAHRARRTAGAALRTALLLGPSLRPAVRARAVPREWPLPAR